MSEGGSTRVLVVEDDQLTRTFLRHALNTAGLTTVDAINGEEALAIAGNDVDFATVIVDGLLPDMHGWALATRLLEKRAAALVPVMFLTGALRHPIAPRAGVAAMLKPIRVIDLTNRIHELREWQRAGGSPIAERREALADLESRFLVGP